MLKSCWCQSDPKKERDSHTETLTHPQTRRHTRERTLMATQMLSPCSCINANTNVNTQGHNLGQNPRSHSRNAHALTFTYALIISSIIISNIQNVLAAHKAYTHKARTFTHAHICYIYSNNYTLFSKVQ